MHPILPDQWDWSSQLGTPQTHTWHSFGYSCSVKTVTSEKQTESRSKLKSVKPVVLDSLWRGRRSTPDSPLFPLVCLSLWPVLNLALVLHWPALSIIRLGCKVPPLFRRCHSSEWLTSCLLVERGKRCYWVCVTEYWTCCCSFGQLSHSCLPDVYKNRGVKSRRSCWLHVQQLHYLLSFTMLSHGIQNICLHNCIIINLW